MLNKLYKLRPELNSGYYDNPEFVVKFKIRGRIIDFSIPAPSRVVLERRLNELGFKRYDISP